MRAGLRHGRLSCTQSLCAWLLLRQGSLGRVLNDVECRLGDELHHSIRTHLHAWQPSLGLRCMAASMRTSCQRDLQLIMLLPPQYPLLASIGIKGCTDTS